MDSTRILYSIDKFRNFLIKSINHISLSQSKKIVFLIFLLMNILYTLVQNYIPVTVTGKIFIFTVLFVISITFSLKSDFEKVPSVYYRKKSVIPFFIFSLLGIGTGMTAIIERSIAYMSLSIVFFIILPLSYSMLSIDNILFLIEQYTRAYIYYLALLFSFSMLFIPLQGVQYTSFFRDSNELAYTSILGVVFICYHLRDNNEPLFSKKHSFYMIMLGVTISFLFASTSRTGMALTLVILSYELMHAICCLNSRKDLKYLIIKLFFIIFIAVMTFLWITYITHLILHLFAFLKTSIFKNKLDKIMRDLIINKGNTSEYLNKGNTSEYLNKGNTSEYLEEFEGKISKGLSNNMSLLSGRFEIWRVFIKKISFWGHKREVVYEPIHFRAEMFAHNTFLQVWYSLGFIAMIGHLLNILFVLTKCFVFITKILKLDRFKILYLEVAFVTIGFMTLYSLYNPFYSSIPFSLMLITFANKRYEKNSFLKISDRIYHSVPSLEK